MLSVPPIVPQQQGRLTIAYDEHVQISIVVVVPKGGSTPHALRRKRRARGSRHIGERPIPVVPKDLIRLCIGHQTVEQINVAVHVPVGDVQIQISIVVVVQKTRAEGQHAQGLFPQSGRKGHIAEQPTPIIPIQRIALPLEAGCEKVQIPVVVVVPEIRAHPRLPLPILVVRYSGSERYLRERPISVVPIQKIGHHIVGYKQVRIAVVVVIAEYDP